MSLIPENIYNTKITRAEIGETSTGKPFVRLHLQLTTEGEFQNRQTVKDLYLSDAAWEKSVETLKKLGFVGEDINAVTTLAGKTCVAKIVIKAQTNKDNTVRTDANGEVLYKNEVAWVGTDNSAKPMEATKAATFAEKMRARLQSMNSGGTTPAPATTADDLPF